MTPVINDPAPYFPTLSPLRRLATPTKMNPTSAKVTPKTWCLTIALFSIYFERIQVEIMVPPDSIWLIEAGINRIETICREDPMESQREQSPIQYWET
jgi:hypothetical protein